MIMKAFKTINSPLVGNRNHLQHRCYLMSSRGLTRTITKLSALCSTGTIACSLMALLPLMFLFSSLSAAGTGLQVISSSVDELVIKWNIPEYKLVPVEVQGEVFHHISGEFLYYRQEEGHPKLPYFTENIGIPPDGDIELYISETEKRVIRNVNVYPAYRIVAAEVGDSEYGLTDVKLGSEFYLDRAVYRSRADYPSQIVEKGVTAFAADRRFYSFILNPFIFNPATKELTVITSGVINVRIRGDKTITRNFVPGRSYIDKAGDLFFANDEQSFNWRQPKEYSPDYTRSSGTPEIQFVVDTEGIYRVTYDDMKEHLIEWSELYGDLIDFDIDSIDPRFLEMSSQYGVTPIHFEGERNGSFDPGDYFEFYGQRNFGKEGYSDTYTAENIYTMRISERWGARMAVESGGIRETNPRNFIQPVSYQHTIHLEEQNTYSSLSTYRRAPREDLWFWKTIRAPELSVTPFQLEFPDQTFMRGFDAAVCLVGSTDTGHIQPDHHARIRINSAFVNAHRWYGQSEQLFINNQFLSNHYLSHGMNYLYVDMPGDTPAGNMEAVFLDYLTLTYWREYKTDKDYIKFTKPSNRPLGLYQFVLENFSAKDISVYKVNASVIENLQIEAFSETGVAPYTVTFQDILTSHNTEYIAVSAARKLKPKQIRPRFPSSLKNPDNAADYIIVTVRDFMESEGTLKLKGMWEESGYLVKLVDVQNIFDEFNNGVRSADAMRDFFSYAYHNWSIPMTDVLLLGKGIFDERDHSVHRKVNLIPYRNIWTFKLGATPSDNWFACIVGNDIVPDFNIARITAWDEDQILAVAQKTAHYKENPNFNDLWHSKVTLVAGGQAGVDEAIFAQQNEAIRRRWIPRDYDVLRVYSATGNLPQQYQGGTFRLRDAWNSGTVFIQFMGHGGGRIWADYNLLNNRDIATLNNSNYPFVNSLSCYPADFSRPGGGSIGENMVLTANRGAVAHFGFTGLGYLHQDLDVGYHLSEALFNRKLGRFGDIVSFTKAKTYTTLWGVPNPQIALVQSAMLFGDPMLSFNLPRERVGVELNRYNVTEGDTVRITVNMGQEINFARIYIQDQNEITRNVPFDIPVVNGVFQTSYVVPEFNQTQYQRLIKVYGYGTDKQVLGITNFTVGRATVTDNITIPAEPTPVDSIRIAARFFHKEGIASVICRIGNIDRQMVLTDAARSLYTTEHPFPPFAPGTGDGTEYRFIITTSADNQIVSETFRFRVLAPDLELYHLEFTSKLNKPAVRGLVKNIGSHPSPATILNVYQLIGNQQTLLNSAEVLSLQPLEEKWIYVTIPPVRGNIRFRGNVNENGSFIEMTTGNNQHTTAVQALNMFVAGVADTTVFSLDDNLKIDIPANLFAKDEILFIRSSLYKEPLHQPDAHTIPLTNNSLSTAYEIGIFNREALADTTGILPANKRIRLTLNYNPNHQKTIEWQGRERFAYYRWEAGFQKWVNQGGFLDNTNHLVFREINRLGTYTILHNTDTTGPTIRANVQDQEFTFGGYISGTGVISLMLSDANGIDLFDREITLFLNENRISEDDYTIAANPLNLTSVPIKYQLNLDAGNYTLFISCSDVNGNYKDHSINFVVSTKFDVINLANYPNPVVTNSIDPINANRTRFTYVLTDDADEVKINIYTVSGRLVRTLDNLPTGVGYHEYPRTIYAWDCRDDKGVLLANGIYFYKVIAVKNNTTVERIQKMAIAR